MALRLFIYYLELLQIWIKHNKINVFSQQKIPDLPVPEFYVVYNGQKPLTDIYSTFNLESKGIKVDVQVKILDIHYNNLQDVSPNNTLVGYSYFYKTYDEGIANGQSRQSAFEAARETTIKKGYLHGFIDKEDFIMFYKDILDYDTQLKAEGVEEGIAKGKAEGLAKGLAKGKAEGLAEGINKLAALIKRGLSLDEAMALINEETTPNLA